MSFQMPDTLPENAAELNALLDSVRVDIREFQTRHDNGEELNRDDAAALRALLDNFSTIQTAATAAEVTEAANAAELSAMLDEAAGAVAASTEMSAQNSEAPVAPPAPDAPETPAAPAPAAPAASSGAFAGVGTTELTEQDDQSGPGWLMHPGAPGYRPDMGKVGFSQIAAALETLRPGSRASFRPNRSPQRIGGEEFARQVISTLPREVEVVEDSHALVAAITAATTKLNGKAVTTESLTAAGGWCAPSEQLYDFCDVPNATDLISLPEITINRGGIRWPIEPDLSAIFEDFEFFFTEPELEAVDANGRPTAVKNCVEIPCANEFNEIRLNAVGWCVESGILQEQGWPELSAWFMQQLTQEHLRAISRRTILSMVAGSGSALIVPPTSVMGSVASVLNSLALVATNLRLKRGLARNTPVEGVAPSWFFEVLRADLAYREGTDIFSISDAQITAWLSARNIVLQFVGDWQTRATGLPGNLQTLTWPGTVDIMLYPAGTWFRSMSNVIELGVMYPKEQLQVNRFTRMFTEDAIAIGKRCYESILTRIPLQPNGAIGARQSITITPSVATRSVAVSGSPDATSTFDLVFSSGKTAAGISVTAAVAAAKTALVGMDDGYGAGDFTVSGGPLGTSPLVITYPASLGTLTVTPHLTGGTNPAVTVS